MVLLAVALASLSLETGLWGEVKVGGADARFEAAYRYADGTFKTYVADVRGEVSASAGVTLSWTFEPDAQATADYVWLKLDAANWKGGSVVLPGRTVSLPPTHELGKAVHLATGESAEYAFVGPDGRTRFSVVFDRPVSFHCMDEREWNVDGFVWRFYRTRGASTPFALTVGGDGGVSLSEGKPYVIEKGPNWIPLRETGSILAGSALDFSAFSDGPCGKYGRVVVRNGHFEFERKPGVRQRFYGPNVCTGANVARADVIEAYVDQLVRRGYNAIRFHHHDGVLAEGHADASLNVSQLELMDNFLDACRRKGVYVTTDVFVSRVIPWSSIGESRGGTIGMDAFKALVLVHEGAYSNLCQFARDWLTHRNGRSGLTWAEDPTLAFLAFVNEGHLGMDGLETLNALPGYPEAWKAWGGEGPIPSGKPWDDTAGAAKAAEFLASLEMKFATRFSRFLREELGVRALLSDMSSGMEREPFRKVRESAAYDYVDEHFYWDHPNWVKTAWQLPAISLNENPVKAKGGDLMAAASRVRVAGKPFVATEWDFTGPSVYRSLAGLVGGSEMAREDWGAAWRFCGAQSPWEMAHSEEVKAGFFSLAGDPLARATEYAAVCLFRRGDGDAAAVSFDRQTGDFAVKGEVTSGGFSESGMIRGGNVVARGDKGPMCVWASSVDGRPLKRSVRIVVFQLTDVQNAGETYKDAERKIVLDWGKVPHLVRADKTRIGLQLEPGTDYCVYALATDGSRLREVKSTLSTCGRLSFAADVAADPEAATFLYEVVRKGGVQP